MAHELLIDNGRVAMFYVDEEPWHGLGTRLDHPPSSQEAMRVAGLDWTVAKAPLYIAGGTRLHEVPDRFALVREDKIGQPDCDIFGIAGRSYVLLQNREAFQFFDPLVSDGTAIYETAGALGRGERVWIQARLQGDAEIVTGDPVRRFLLLSNSHDGSSSVQVKLTPIRVVCNNTLTRALSQGRTIQVRHDRDMKQRLEHAKELLGVVQAQYDELTALFRRLAAVLLTHERALNYFEDVFPDGSTAETAKRAVNDRRWARHFYEHGRGNDLPKVRGTLWAAYNGVTELVDHRRPMTADADFTTKRLGSIWFGRGATIKGRALELATEISDANVRA
jgi:phage/plasmid-like protein (TIGR03299 family)